MGWGNVGVAMPGPATVNVGIGHPRSTTVVARADARQRDFASRPRHPAAPEGTRQCAPLKDCQIERHRNRRYVRSAFGAVLFSVALTFVLSSVAHAQDAASAAPAPGPTVPATGSPVRLGSRRRSPRWSFTTRSRAQSAGIAQYLRMRRSRCFGSLAATSIVRRRARWSAILLLPARRNNRSPQSSARTLCGADSTRRGQRRVAKPLTSARRPHDLSLPRKTEASHLRAIPG
jgi:hypothetical protein